MKYALTKIATIEEIRDYEVRDHKVSSSPISQVDGPDDSLETVHETKEVIDNKMKLKSQYPRNCEYCGKYLRNNMDFRKHIVACVMARTLAMVLMKNAIYHFSHI